MILQVVLLVGKALFLVILYLFVFSVVRSAVRDLGRAPLEHRTVSEHLVHLGGEEEAEPGAGWRLVVESSPVLKQGAVIPLPADGELLLGRHPESDVELSDTFVSGRHARVIAGRDWVVVEDLGSTNGTFLNGKQVGKTAPVEAGDTISVGDTVFRVEGAS